MAGLIDPAEDDRLATDILTALNAPDAKSAQELQLTLNNLVGSQGWYQSLAVAVLTQIEKILHTNNVPMGQAMKDAYDKALAAAAAVGSFARDHPVFCTLIALGILVVLAPGAVPLMGFGELGPVEGSFAALWQARYAGYVPKGSLFSFLQRLGMVWKH